MTSITGVRLRPASLRRRFAAAAIDATMAIGAFVAMIGGLIAVRRWRDWAPDEDRLRELAANRGLVRRIRFASYVITSLQLSRPEWRGPGYRFLGLRRVDAGTGEAPGLRRRLVQAALDEVVRRAITRLDRPRRQRAESRRAEVEARRAEIRKRFADDPEGLARAGDELSRDSTENCWAALLPPLALTSIVPLTALASPRRQTLVERVAGTVVARD